MRIPVIDKNQRPLMPTTPARAEKWIASKKATPFWKKGIFCVRLNIDPSDTRTQPIAVGIDPGSKTEGFTVKSKNCTHLNLQATAVMHVKDALEVRRNMRRTRRNRGTPCRTPKLKSKHQIGFMPPSTKARWQWKLRICRFLKKIFPISDFVVEDIKAKALAGARRWNMHFSPLEVGKNWFYGELAKLGTVITKQGYETAALRDQLGLKKSKSNPLAFAAHCTDSWVLANSVVEGHTQPENTSMIYIKSLIFHRRQLHYLVPSKAGVRTSYGGTQSLGFKRGSLVHHLDLGLAYVGGTMDDRISLHAINNGKRLTQNSKPEECQFLGYNSWRWQVSSPIEEVGIRLAKGKI